MFDAPQWLMPSWIRTCREAGATADEDRIREVGTRLLERWVEPGRRFHSSKHLCSVLARVDELAEETHDPALVRLAVWYHGAVFNASDNVPGIRPGENKEASANLAVAELTELGVPAPRVERVREMISALARHQPPDPSDFDCAVLCDADLSILAAEPQRYAKYLRALREEYDHIPVRDYLEARKTIITKLLGRKRIFQSPLTESWEDPARQNLQVELHRVNKELTKLDAGAPLA